MPLTAARPSPVFRAHPRTAPATQAIRVPGRFQFHRGGELSGVEVAFETWGELAPNKDNGILVFTGLSPGPHAAASPADPTPGWWDYLVGPGRPLDTERFFVVCVNSLGSCFGSTGPASLDPRTGRPYGLGFPELTVEDIARAGHQAMGVLGIETLRAVVGASLGGMSALAYAILFPDGVRDLVSISSAPHSTPHAIAVRSLQREVIRSDPEWKDGRYALNEGPLQGMHLARKLGVTTYRSAQEWQQRFGRKRVISGQDHRRPFSMEFEVEAYLEHLARRFVGSFDANCYLYLSRAMDWFDVADHGNGSLEAGFARIQARRTLVIGVETDGLFPIRQQRQIAEILHAQGRDVVFSALASIQGHDAFLVDKERFAPVVRDFFKR